MAGHSTAALGFAGAVMAAAVGGPLAAVFSELALALTIMGAAGGVTRGLANRDPWREIVRGGFLGGLLAFGFGALSPQVLGHLISVEFMASASGVPLLAAGAFSVGFVQDVIINTFGRRRGDDV